MADALTLEAMADECLSPGRVISLREAITRALAQAHAEGLEAAAVLVSRWHISKGGYAELAHQIRFLAAGVAGQPSGDAKGK
jgi:hypothetical protein